MVWNASLVITIKVNICWYFDEDFIRKIIILSGAYKLSSEMILHLITYLIYPLRDRKV